MTARQIGLWLGPALFALTLIFPAPAGLEQSAWHVAGPVGWMAAWWMTEAIPLSATALLPFAILPLFGAGTANIVAADYYSPILFLLLGGSFLALAIERTGLHKRIAVAILDAIGGRGGATGLLLGFMIAAAVLSNIISNTSTALIMMPMALAVLAGGEATGERNPASSSEAIGQPAPASSSAATGFQEGLAGALPMGIAFAATIGGLGTVIGSPTNAISVALLAETTGLEISFALWAAFGVPVVLLGVPLACWVIARVQRLGRHPFDMRLARTALHEVRPWTSAERRLIIIIALTFTAWMTRPLYDRLLPEGSVTDGTIAVIAALALFILPDGNGRRMLNWREADRAPWGVILMFGGGLALAAAMTRTGLAGWLGEALLPLTDVPLLLIALAMVALVILVTEFASNVATASGFMPVVASLAIAIGGDPVLLAMSAAIAASWGFMLPSASGPNALAWATGRIALPRLVTAGFALDLIGIVLIVSVVWGVTAIL